MKWRLWIAPLLIGIALFGCGKHHKDGILQNESQDSISAKDFEGRRKDASTDLRFTITLGMFVADFDEKSIRDPACEVIEAYYSLNNLYGMKDPHDVSSKEEAMEFVKDVSLSAKKEVENDGLRLRSYQIGIGVSGVVMASSVAEELYDAEIDSKTEREAKSKLNELYEMAFTGLKQFSEEIGLSDELQNKLGEIKDKAMSIENKSDVRDMSYSLAKWGASAAEEIGND